MKQAQRYDLVQDRKGMTWDLLLYVPTVIALFSIGLKLWYSPNQTWGYVLFFMGFFFALVGGNRVLSSRLMLLPSAPVALIHERDQITVELRSGERVDLVKEARYYPDYAGKSFGLSGMDLAGRRRQFVFHRGQFAEPQTYRELCQALAVFK